MPLGLLFRVSLFGESHGPGVGVLVEGAPPGLPLSVEEVNRELERRRPGRRFTTPRREPDRVEILSGVYMGYTTGAPILMLIRNRDVDSSFYEEVVRHRPRPGHADLPARLRSMGFEDYRGGGPFSGRLTAGLVAAAAVARKLLRPHGVEVYGYLRRLGRAECSPSPPAGPDGLRGLVEARDTAPLPCPDPEAVKRMERELVEAVKRGGSVGGQAEIWVLGLPPGLGEPLGDSLDGDIARALFAVPGVKAVEFGSGTRLAEMTGLEAADSIRVTQEGGLSIEPGHGGGVLGGLSTGSPVVVRATFKPTSTIPYPLETIDWRGLQEATITGRGRHDPAIAVRGVVAAEAAVAIAVADHLLRWLPIRVGHYHALERGLTTRGDRDAEEG